MQISLGLVDLPNGTIMLVSSQQHSARGSNECIFRHELGGITQWDFSHSTHEFEYGVLRYTHLVGSKLNRTTVKLN